MMTITQIKVGVDNFSYLIQCEQTYQGALVDPGVDAAKAIQFIAIRNLDLKYIILTHHHSDHTISTAQIQNTYPDAQIVASKEEEKQMGFPIDQIVSDADILQLGTVPLTIIHTPGHTPGGICILVNKTALLTGDTLFIGDCGRTDLPGGDVSQMFHSLHEKIMKLPDELIVYPGHDYGNKPFDTLGNQKRTNKILLESSLHKFSQIP